MELGNGGKKVTGECETTIMKRGSRLVSMKFYGVVDTMME